MLGVKSTMDAESAFISTMDDRASTRFSFSSASSYLENATYVTEEEIIEQEKKEIER